MAFAQFEDIEGWQEARKLTQCVYQLTRKHEFFRDYGLKDQITRAAVSVMNNIAEGFDGGSDAEFVRFLVYAQRSATEVQSCLYVALDNKYIDESEFKEAYQTAGNSRKIIGGLIKYLKVSR